MKIYLFVCQYELNRPTSVLFGDVTDVAVVCRIWFKVKIWHEALDHTKLLSHRINIRLCSGNDAVTWILGGALLPLLDLNKGTDQNELESA